MSSSSPFANRIKNACSAVPIAYRVGALVLITLLVICFASKASVTLKQRTYSKPFVKHLESLTQQCYQWQRTAQQDTDPYLALVHSSYAIGVHKAIRQISEEADFKRITGMDAVDFESDLEALHEKLMASVQKI